MDEKPKDDSGFLHAIVGISVWLGFGFSIAILNDYQKGLGGTFAFAVFGSIILYYTLKYIFGAGLKKSPERTASFIRNTIITVVVIMVLGMLSKCTGSDRGENCYYKVGCV